ncbi:MAG: hypothetical protein ACKO3N_01270, partial [Verrucomicrobiota bacterium]
GGVFVLNPPYLLHYPDANRDDIPDGDPQVLLSGFGLEDTHSVANSLRWGPDGWLYGCQGSTVTGNIRVHGPDGKPLNDKPIYSQGQNIWRYHPERRIYEVFSEGGGNAFGLEIDSAGRIFSGHNGGNTRGFHYQQGAYLQKGFDKHGPLSNPHAFGYFPQMPHPDVDRFTHNFLIYDSGALGERYRGRLFGVEPLQGRVVMSEITPDGSTFRTRDLGHPVTSDDRWFRPVDIKLGPDGAIYVGDWYDRQVNHYRNHEDLRRDGRIAVGLQGPEGGPAHLRVPVIAGDGQQHRLGGRRPGLAEDLDQLQATGAVGLGIHHPGQGFLDGSRLAPACPQQRRFPAGGLHGRDQFLRQPDQRPALVRLLESLGQPGGGLGTGGHPEQAGADQQVLPPAGGGEASHQPRKHRLLHQRRPPKLAVPQQRQHLLPVGPAFVLDRPPQQQRLAGIPGIGVPGEEVPHDGQPGLGGESLGGGGQLRPDL